MFEYAKSRGGALDLITIVPGVVEVALPGVCTLRPQPARPHVRDALHDHVEQKDRSSPPWYARPHHGNAAPVATTGNSRLRSNAGVKFVRLLRTLRILRLQQGFHLFESEVRLSTTTHHHRHHHGSLLAGCGCCLTVLR